MKDVREKLELNREPWLELDDDLLRLAFTRTGKVAETLDKYGLKDAEELEWLGDSIVELIVTLDLFEKIVINRKKDAYTQLSNYRSTLVRNTNLYCYMKDRDLCQHLILCTDRELKVKDCADAFESIIGVLYFHLVYIKNDPAPFLKIHQWYNRHFNLADQINQLIKYKKTDYYLEFPAKTKITDADRYLSGTEKPTKKHSKKQKKTSTHKNKSIPPNQIITATPTPTPHDTISDPQYNCSQQHNCSQRLSSESQYNCSQQLSSESQCNCHIVQQIIEIDRHQILIDEFYMPPPQFKIHEPKIYQSGDKQIIVVRKKKYENIVIPQTPIQISA